MKIKQKQAIFEKIGIKFDENKKYNSYLILQTLYLFKRAQKIYINRCLDFSVKKKFQTH